MRKKGEPPGLGAKKPRPHRRYDVGKESLDWSFRANEKLSTVIRIVAICGNNGRGERRFAAVIRHVYVEHVHTGFSIPLSVPSPPAPMRIYILSSATLRRDEIVNEARINFVGNVKV